MTLDTFACHRHSGKLTLTPGACASMWRRGKAARPFDSVWACKGCAVGAGHAGEPESASPAVAPDTVCVRCGSIGRRMIRSQGICVSCYNREREIAVGKDRRGKPPVRPAQVPIMAIEVNGQPAARQAAGLTELILWALRKQISGRVSRIIERSELLAKRAKDEPVYWQTRPTLKVSDFI